MGLCESVQYNWLAWWWYGDDKNEKLIKEDSYKSWLNQIKEMKEKIKCGCVKIIKSALDCGEL